MAQIDPWVERAKSSIGIVPMQEGLQRDVGAEINLYSSTKRSSVEIVEIVFAEGDGSEFRILAQGRDVRRPLRVSPEGLSTLDFKRFADLVGVQCGAKLVRDTPEYFDFRFWCPPAVERLPAGLLVGIDIDEDVFNRVVGLLLDAIAPSVPYSGDVVAMREAARKQSYDSVIAALGLFPLTSEQKVALAARASLVVFDEC